MADGILLQIESLTKSFVPPRLFGTKKSVDRPMILDRLSLSIPSNRIIALVGPNGAGKTTLFNVLTGFLSVESGDAFLLDGRARYSLLGRPPHEIVNLGRGVGRMFQDDHIFLEMTILENMLISSNDGYGEMPFMTWLHRSEERRREKARSEKAFEVFRLLFGNRNSFWERRALPARALSFGEQRLLGLARIFMRDYALVLLDEPTAGIHPTLIDHILSIVRAMVEKGAMTVFMIEHNMQAVEKIADFCCFMDEGKIAFHGTPLDVLGNDGFRRTYLGY